MKTYWGDPFGELVFMHDPSQRILWIARKPFGIHDTAEVIGQKLAELRSQLRLPRPEQM